MPTYTLYAQADQSDQYTPIATLEAAGLNSVPTKVEAFPGSSDETVTLVKGLQDDMDRIEDKSWATVLRLGASYGNVVEKKGRSLVDTMKKAREREVTKNDPDDAFDLMASGDIQKADKAQQIVFGWAYVTHDKDGNVNIDKSGDFVDAIEEIEKSAYDFVLNSRSSDADHTNVKGGTLVESIVFTPEKIEKMGLPAGSVPLGWWLGFKIEDAATWARVEKRELTCFSIHGSGVRAKVEDS